MSSVLLHTPLSATGIWQKKFSLFTACLNPTWERYSWKEGQVFYLTLTTLRWVVTAHDVCLLVLRNKVNLIITWPLKKTEIIGWTNHCSKSSRVRWMVIRASRCIIVFPLLTLINEITAGQVKEAMSQSAQSIIVYVECFPALHTGLVFSRGSRLLRGSPRLILSQCFPALHADPVFYCASPWLWKMFSRFSAIHIGRILPNVWQ